ncbi:hypothetical protein CEUSTIGMA_g8071.t1 [Chlamydomonas eustigma]|uniref:Uncharacterized protein n=1 Tax=Chlamydomonas eustigma TaxID=1157962 RepID=A0A250XC58_9CHLO|nr:hypothetical protein CEUSTIGMA_g8071.t1 [Chlamydomonas eustigma]|eukprot:GAX80636.1 hypothetical protein CEUSTIGMA_g8071.t1 [Chlamydomonas eustigma]
MYIKSATEAAQCDYLQAMHRHAIRNPWSRECKFKQDFEASPATLGIERLNCKDRPVHGPSTYFLSHCWSYKLKDLIGLVMRHYDSQSGTAGGRHYQPLYYWVDIFAVQQNFKGDFKDHPDSDFPAVIRASQAVLFTIMPWRAPLCVERVWCLFEALQAITAHVDLDLLVEDVQSTQNVDKLQQVFTKELRKFAEFILNPVLDPDLDPVLDPVLDPDREPADPDPYPDPEPDPDRDPDPDPDPDPDREPDPDPDPDREPDPDRDPDREPDPDPDPDPGRYPDLLLPCLYCGRWWSAIWILEIARQLLQLTRHTYWSRLKTHCSCSDKAYILEQIENTLSIDRFNQMMQDALRRGVMEVLLMLAVQKNDFQTAKNMVRNGAKVMQRVLYFSGQTAFDANDNGLRALAEVMKVSGAVQTLTLHTTANSKAGPEGYAALMSVLKNNRSLKELNMGKGPKDDLKSHEGGWLGPKSANAVGEMLAFNTVLRHLDLSRNIRLGGAGAAGIARGLAAAEASALQDLVLSQVAADSKSVALLAEALSAATAVPLPQSRGASSNSFTNMNNNPADLLLQNQGSIAMGRSSSNTQMTRRSSVSILNSPVSPRSPLAGSFSRGSLAGAGPSSSSLFGFGSSGRAVSPLLLSRSNTKSQKGFTFNLLQATGASRGPSSASNPSSPLGGAGLRGLNVPGSPTSPVGLNRSGSIATRGSPTSGTSSASNRLFDTVEAARASGYLLNRIVLKRLDLSFNALGDGEGMTALGTMLSKSTPNLQQLLLRGCDIGPAGGRMLADGISSGAADQRLLLTHLDMGSNRGLGDEAGSAIVNALKKCPNLQSLSLDGCNLKAGCATAIGSLLNLSDAPISELVLGENSNFGNVGVQSIGQGLRAKGRVGTLSRLVLSRCGITSRDGMAGVAAALWSNVSLKDLDLRGNGLMSEEQDACAKVLTDALKGNSTLSRITLTGSFVSTQSFSVSNFISLLQERCKQLEVVLR